MKVIDKIYYKKRSDFISFFFVFIHILVVIFPVYITAALGFGWYVFFCWLFVGASMNGLLNLLHECSHYLVFNKKSRSDVFGNYILGPLLFSNIEVYRTRHWDHHRYLGKDGETKDTYFIEIKKWRILNLLYKCVFMIQAKKMFFKQIGKKEKARKISYKWLIHLFLFQFIFFISLLFIAWLANPHYRVIEIIYNVGTAYFFVYMYGLISLTVFMATIRAIIEHQIINDGAALEGKASLRNFKTNFLSKFLMGAYGFSEHYTHHSMPGIPYYNLKKATREMGKYNSLLNPKGGYFNTLFNIIKS